MALTAPVAVIEVGNTSPREPAPTKAVPAVRRAAAILWMLADCSKPMSLSEIARAVDILPSTALHILREMTAARLIHFDPVAKLYELGQGIINLAQAVKRRDNFTVLAQPYLEEIATRFEITATATALIDPHHMACVTSIAPPNAMSLNVTLGGRVPIFSGAVGRCVAAFGRHSPAQLKRSFEHIRWQTPLSYEQWLDQVERTRCLGYGVDDGHFALGVTTLAVPVMYPDGPVARAIGTASISATLDHNGRTAIASALMTAASEIALLLQG